MKAAAPVPLPLLQGLVNAAFCAWQWVDADDDPGEYASRGRTYKEAAALLRRHNPKAVLPRRIRPKKMTIQELHKRKT